MPLTPEQRRDEAIADVLEAGGVILAEPAPLATVDDPHTIAAYRLTTGAPDLAVRNALRTVRTATQTETAGLIDWSPAPQPEIEPEPPIEYVDPEGETAPE